MATSCFSAPRNGAIVSGVVTVSNRSAPVPSRYLTRLELSGLENLLGLYRREEHQGRCFSTGQHSTTFHATGGNLAEHYDTDSCIEVEYVEEGPSFSIRPRSDIISLYELTRPAYDELFRHSSRHCLTSA